MALDSSRATSGRNKTDHDDVIVVGSYCGTRVVAPIFTRGVKAVVATDAGIGKDNAGISGLNMERTSACRLRHRCQFGGDHERSPDAAPGIISRANAQARALGVKRRHDRL